jgi:hypothetical protein
LTPVSNPTADSGVDEELAIIEEDGITDAVDCNVSVGDDRVDGNELVETDTSDPVDAAWLGVSSEAEDTSSSSLFSSLSRSYTVLKFHEHIHDTETHSTKHLLLSYNPVYRPHFIRRQHCKIPTVAKKTCHRKQ